MFFIYCFALLCLLVALMGLWVFFIDAPRVPVTSWRHWVVAFAVAPGLAVMVIASQLIALCTWCHKWAERFVDWIVDRIIPSVDP